MTPDARPAGGRRINELMGPNWWRTEAILAARLRDLVAGLDSIGAFTIPYARLPRRLATYADEFPRWADVSRRANVRAPTRSNHVGDREHGAPFRRTARDDLPHCTHMPPYRPNAGIFGLCAGRQNPHASRRVC